MAALGALEWNNGITKLCTCSDGGYSGHLLEDAQQEGSDSLGVAKWKKLAHMAPRIVGKDWTYTDAIQPCHHSSQPEELQPQQ